MLSIDQYRDIADEIGGEKGKHIHDLIDEVEEARAKNIPLLLGGKEVADLLGIDRKNLHHVRKTKGFPEPESYAGNRPLWTRASIIEYKETKLAKKEKGKIP